MTRTRRAVLACAAVMLVAPAAAHAGTLDQSQLVDGEFEDLYHTSAAQTFTAGLTGGLDETDVVLQQIGSAAAAGLTLQIRNVTASGSPGSVLLATANIPIAAVPHFDRAFVATTFDPPVPVTAGTQYAIVLYSDSDTQYWLWGSVGDRYHFGELWDGPSPPTSSWQERPAFDAAFRTFVKPTSVTMLASSVNPSVSGQPVTYTASVAAVAPASGTPTGSVAFTDAGSPIAGCGAVALSAGQAQCTVTYPGPGTHQINATYADSTEFMGSAAALSQEVNTAASATTLVSSVNPSVSGQSVTYTANVTAVAPASGTPSGTVAFTEGTSTICVAVTLSNGQAQCTVTYPGPGTHQITATYAGSTAFAGSAGPLSQMVKQAATNLVAAKATRGGLKITFSATLTRAFDGGALAGKPVAFKISGGTVCSANTNSSGEASCSVGGLVIGSGSYTATFAGDSAYLAKTASGSL